MQGWVLQSVPLIVLYSEHVLHGLQDFVKKTQRTSASRAAVENGKKQDVKWKHLAQILCEPDCLFIYKNEGRIPSEKQKREIFFWRLEGLTFFYLCVASFTSLLYFKYWAFSYSVGITSGASCPQEVMQFNPAAQFYCKISQFFSHSTLIGNVKKYVVILLFVCMFVSFFVSCYEAEAIFYLPEHRELNRYHWAGTNVISSTETFMWDVVPHL